MSPLRKRLNLIAGLAILGGLAWMYYPLLTGEARMQKFCASLSAGTRLGDVLSAAGQSGYAFTVHGGNALIHETSSFGRYVCEAKFENGRLVSASYLYND